MKSIEVQAATIDEARKKAAELLGVEEGSVEVSIVEGGKGLFGKGVRVTAAVIEAKPAKSARGKKAEASAPVMTLEKEPEPEPAAEPVAEPKPKTSRKAKAVEAPLVPEVAPAAASEEEADPHASVVATGEDEEVFLEIANDVLRGMQLDAEAVSGSIQGRYVYLEFIGHDATLLVGRNGDVLNSLQYLLNLMAIEEVQPGVRVVLDAINYRATREDQLARKAKAIAREVRERGEEAVLEPMPAFERRIIHKLLSEIDGITTYSEGDEPNRRVVIAPAE